MAQRTRRKLNTHTHTHIPIVICLLLQFHSVILFIDLGLFPITPLHGAKLRLFTSYPILGLTLRILILTVITELRITKVSLSYRWITDYYCYYLVSLDKHLMERAWAPDFWRNWFLANTFRSPTETQTMMPGLMNIVHLCTKSFWSRETKLLR